MKCKYKMNIEDILIPNGLNIIGAIHMDNKCCPDKPILITQTGDMKVYSCQCSCGGWCTDGFQNISSAIADYERMNARSSVK